MATTMATTMTKIDIQQQLTLNSSENCIEYLYREFDRYGDQYRNAFFTRLNKDGTVPRAFKGWGNGDIFIVEETWSTGWKVHGNRTGTSTSWIVLLHPIFNTCIEIKVKTFIKLMPNLTIINGVIQEECMYDVGYNKSSLIIKTA